MSGYVSRIFGSSALAWVELGSVSTLRRDFAADSLQMQQ
jgi:hypothetical protein